MLLGLPFYIPLRYFGRSNHFKHESCMYSTLTLKKLLILQNKGICVNFKSFYTLNYVKQTILVPQM